MTPALLIQNGAQWALQILLLVAVTGGLLGLLRVTDARLRLRAWHAVVFASLLVPFLQPWQTPAPIDVALSSNQASAFAWQAWLLATVAAGVCVRGAWLMVGLWKLPRLLARSMPWQPAWFDAVTGAAGASASVGASGEIAGAVTYGVRRPAILVPRTILGAPETHQRAVVLHELRHVARRDWLWVLAEEVARTLLWWHPAIWAALAEARLAREEIVDRETAAVTGRHNYLEALVAAAEGGAVWQSGFAPQFYRRRWLKARIRRLLKEHTMSTNRILICTAMLAIVLPATVWAGGSAFPLTSASGPSVVLQDPPPPPPPPPPAPPVPVMRSDRQQPPPPPPPPPRKVASPKAPKVAPPAPPVRKSRDTRADGLLMPPPPPPLKAVSPKAPKIAPPAPPVRKNRGTRVDEPRMPPPPPPAPPKRIKGEATPKEPPPPPPPPPKPAKIIKG